MLSQRLFSLYLPCFLILMLFSACASLNPISEPPSISVANIQIQEIKAMESTFLLELRVINPNDVALDIQGLNCELEIDGQHFARGITSQEETVPSFGTAIIPVQVYASMFDMISSVAGLIQSNQQAASQMKPLDYKLSGYVRIGGHSIMKKLPFEHEGELSFSGITKK